MLTYGQKLKQDVDSELADRLAGHKIVEKHCVARYGHWRCRRPNSWAYGFDIVTWPGSLCITGDIGSYLFQREEDMIAFMRGAARSPEYAAAKCAACSALPREWREEIFLEILRDLKEQSPDRAAEIDKIEETYRSGYESPHDASDAMAQSGLFDELPSCLTFTFEFLFCLAAISWFCDQVKLPSEIGRKEATTA